MSVVKIDIKVVTGAATAAVKKFSDQTVKGMERIGKSQETIRENFRQIRNAAAIGFAGISAAFVAAGVKAAEFETGILGVSKTVNNLTQKELKELGDELIDVSKKTPFTTKELLELAKSAGQLGVEGKDNITLFATTIAKLGTAANVSGEEAATALARILNVTKESTDNVDNLASAIVDLGNNFAATESDIIQAGQGISQTTSQFGVSSAEAVSFGAAVKSLGVQSELARSTFGRSFRAINGIIDEGGIKFRELQKVTNLTGDELKKQFDTNATGVFLKFLQGVKRLEKGGIAAKTTLEQFGLSGDRINTVLPVLAGRIDLVTSAVERGTKAFEENKALEEEYARVSESLANTFQKLINNVNALVTEFGTKLAPAIKALIEGFIGITEFISELTDETKDLIIQIAAGITVFLGLVTVIASLKIALIGIALVISPVTIALTLIAAAIGGLVVWVLRLSDELGGITNVFRLFGATILESLADIILGFKETVSFLGKVEGEFRSFFATIILIAGKTAGRVFKPLLDSIRFVARAMGKELPPIIENTEKEFEKLADEINEGSGSLDNFSERLGKTEENLRAAAKSTIADTKIIRENTAARKKNNDEQKRAGDKPEGTDDNAQVKLKQQQQDLKDFQLNNIKDLSKARRDADFEENVARLDNEADRTALEQARIDQTRQRVGEEFAIRQIAREQERQARIEDLENQLIEFSNNEALKVEIQKEIDNLEKEAAVDRENARKQEALNQQRLEKGKLDTFMRTQEAQAKFAEKTEKEKLASVQNGLTATTGLMKTKSKELFAIGKAAAIANATINTYASAVAAFNAMAGIPIVGPALGAIAAAGAIAAGLANVSAISSQQPGFQDGGIVPGQSFSGDNVGVNVNSGEMILNREQQDRLFQIANGAEPESQRETVINNTIELDGEAIFNSVSRQVADGRELGEVV